MGATQPDSSHNAATPHRPRTIRSTATPRKLCAGVPDPTDLSPWHSTSPRPPAPRGTSPDRLEPHSVSHPVPLRVASQSPHPPQNPPPPQVVRTSCFTLASDVSDWLTRLFQPLCKPKAPAHGTQQVDSSKDLQHHSLWTHQQTDHPRSPVGCLRTLRRFSIDNTPAGRAVSNMRQRAKPLPKVQVSQPAPARSAAYSRASSGHCSGRAQTLCLPSHSALQLSA